MKLTLNVAFAASLALASLGTGALAGPVDISSGSAGFASSPGGGGFTDVYTFTLVSDQTASMIFSSVVGGTQNLDFTSVTLVGNAGTFNATPYTLDPYESWRIDGVALTPGAYTVTAKGNNSADAASYAGSVALSGSSQGSNSSSGGPLDLTTGSTGFFNTPKAGDFSDVYSFTLSSARAVSVLLSSVVGGLQDVDFSKVSLVGPSGTFIATELTADPFQNWVLSTPLLNAGGYTLTVGGTNSDAVGTYVGSIAVSATGPTPPNSVPEPGSYVLLLAGLGASCFAMRRGRVAGGRGPMRSCADASVAKAAG